MPGLMNKLKQWKRLMNCTINFRLIMQSHFPSLCNEPRATAPFECIFSCVEIAGSRCKVLRKFGIQTFHRSDSNKKGIPHKRPSDSYRVLSCHKNSKNNVLITVSFIKSFHWFSMKTQLVLTHPMSSIEIEAKSCQKPGINWIYRA